MSFKAFSIVLISSGMLEMHLCRGILLHLKELFMTRKTLVVSTDWLV